jgi:hypothetical protein
LLAGAAGPGALVSPGSVLARGDPTNVRPRAAAWRSRPVPLVALKLIAQPLVTAKSWRARQESNL